MPATVVTRTQVEPRPVWPAIWNGMRLRCPHCGQGHLFRAYLKVNDTCEHCGEELFHHRADDLPPYLSIVIVGHVLIGLMLDLQMNFHLDPMFYMLTMVPIAIVLPLLLLPSIKGAVVGLQWANRMHGFDAAQRDAAAPDYR